MCFWPQEMQTERGGRSRCTSKRGAETSLHVRINRRLTALLKDTRKVKLTVENMSVSLKVHEVRVRKAAGGGFVGLHPLRNEARAKLNSLVSSRGANSETD